MAYIYQITNDINEKIYVGKTEFSIEKRFKEHCRDAFKERNEKRPLYSAMRKYGIEHFHIELIEETDNPEEREVYWIEQKRSFKNGYNATLGGDGKRYCDYDLIYSLYKEGLNIKEVAKILNYSTDTCSRALNQYGISKEERSIKSRLGIIKPVIQIDKSTNQILNIFPSVKAAYDCLGKQHSGHIAAVCNGKRKTAYGYKWKYGETS